MLAVIGLLVAGGGKVLLAQMAQHRLLAALVLAGLVVAAVLGLRRNYLTPSDDARLVVTKNSAYLVAAALALWQILAPAKWVPGSCIAAAEVAIVFDIIMIAARRGAPGGA
jgi:hypothetical protein